MIKDEEKELLNTILDLGAALLQNGADTHKTEKNLYRVCKGYHFTNANIWVVPSNIQASVTTPEGEDLTMIRHVRDRGTNYARLAKLNNLAREISEAPLKPDELREAFETILSSKPEPARILYLAAVLGSGGFGIFFGCDFKDALAAALSGLVVSIIGRKLTTFEKNPLVYNFTLSLIAELIILLFVRIGLGAHIGRITIGVVMLLISGIGFTTGIKDLMHLDTLSGMMKITESFLGAIGIAIGIGLPLYLFRNAASNDLMMMNPSVLLQLVFCTVGCIGFALWFNVKWQHLPLCAAGALLTWGVYLIAEKAFGAGFVAAFISATVCALYAQITARIAKAPSTIFMSVSVFPLVPGAALYYTMYGIVLQDTLLAKEKGATLLMTCFAIGLGMMVVEVIVRLERKLKRK